MDIEALLKEATEENVNAKTLKYFMGIWPILMSLGLGGSIMGAFYTVYYYVRQKVLERWMCSVEITDKDPTFDWVQKFMKDKGMVKEEGFLKVTKKIPDDGEEAWINRSNDKSKPEVDYNQGSGTYIVTF